MRKRVPMNQAIDNFKSGTDEIVKDLEAKNTKDEVLLYAICAMSTMLVILLSIVGIMTLCSTSANAQELYNYRAKVVDVYDGDSYKVNIDLGLHVTLNKVKIRVYGVDTPEIRGKSELHKLAGKKVRAYVVSKILNKDIVLSTLRDKQSKYGDYLGIFTRGSWKLHEDLVSKKYAHAYYGKKKVPFTDAELRYIINSLKNY